MMKRLCLFLFMGFLVPMLAAGNLEDSLQISRKVERLHKRILTVDSHTDTPLRMMQKDFSIAARHDPVTDHTRVDLPRMKEGGLDAAFFAVFVSQGKRTPEGNEKARQRIQVLMDTVRSAVARYPGQAGLACSPRDAMRLKKQDKRAIFIGIENGYAIGNDLDLIRKWYDEGARYITLCHTKNNDICDSSTDSTEYNGLSEFGKNVVLFMNKTGMMIDVSHISDKAFYDVLGISRSPVIASHSCARALCSNPRNLDDDMLRALARNGGVIQVCLLSAYVKTPEPNPARDSARQAVRKKFNDFDGLSDDEMKKARRYWYTVDEQFPEKLATVKDVADHIDHIVRVAGIRHAGIGTDFDGGGGVTGCYDAGQMKNITRELVLRGYSGSGIRKIWGGNLMRVMRKAEKISHGIKRACGCH
jgi:membrane dipeptidase